VREPRQRAPFGRRAARVSARRQLGPYVLLRCVDPSGPAPQAGQFYMLATAEGWGGGEGERPFLPRAFSVLRASSKVEDGVELEFLLDDVGPGTHRLSRLAADELLLLVGPLGSGFTVPRRGRRPLLVGGGIGVAPLAILQDELGGEASALLGFRSGGHALAASLLSQVQLATDDGSVGHHGLVTDLLEAELHRSAGEAEVYACGPPAMLEAVRLLCAEHQVPAQLALESGMACGFGACFGCVVPTRTGLVRLCLEGPVLDAGLLESALVPGAPH
jgi:dihydroorotate dehydrogenase electron transfer subunit